MSATVVSITNQLAYTDAELEQLPPQEDVLTRCGRTIDKAVETIGRLRQSEQLLLGEVAALRREIEDQCTVQHILEDDLTKAKATADQFRQEYIALAESRHRRFRIALAFIPFAFGWGFLFGHFIHF